MRISSLVGSLLTMACLLLFTGSVLAEEAPKPIEPAKKAEAAKKTEPAPKPVPVKKTAPVEPAKKVKPVKKEPAKKDGAKKAQPAKKDATKKDKAKKDAPLKDGKKAEGKDGKKAEGKDGKKKEGETCEDDKCDLYKDFVKGELLTVGSANLLGERSRAGVRLGYRAIGYTHYGTIDPGVDLRFGKFHIGLSVPLNIEIWDGSGGLVAVDTSGGDTDFGVNGFGNAGTIRAEDWDHWRDYFRVLRHLGWGRKEDFLYINLAQEGAASIGHGLIMKRYMPQIDIDTVRVGAQVDAYLDWLGGFEFYTNDITSWNMLGTLAFIKPLGPFIDTWMARSLSVGFTFVTDLKAPVSLATEGGRFKLDAGLDETHPEAARTTAVSIWGIDTEIKLVKTKRADIKVYVDYSKMVDHGWGATVGGLGRFNADGKKLKHAFRTRLEGRFFTGNYEPSYFDSFYEIDRWQMLTGTNNYLGTQSPINQMPTKYDYITSRNKDMQFGYFVEAGYSIIGKFSIGTAFEGQVPDDNYKMLIHLDAPVHEYFRLKATYQKRHFSEFGTMFNFEEDNEWLSGLVRIKILPILFLNGQIGHLWSLNRNRFEAGSKKGKAGPDFGLYQASWDWRIWLDAAYEW